MLRSLARKRWLVAVAFFALFLGALSFVLPVQTAGAQYADPMKPSTDPITPGMQFSGWGWYKDNPNHRFEMLLAIDTVDPVSHIVTGTLLEPTYGDMRVFIKGKITNPDAGEIGLHLRVLQ